MKNTYFICLVVFMCQDWTYSLPACTKGWFGENCMYKCNCAGNVACSNEGVCVNNTACSSDDQIFFFGPGCQYVDLAKSWGSSVSNLLITDQNDFTCNEWHRTMIITLKTPLPFMWIRIVFRLINPEDSTTDVIFGLHVNNNKEICDTARMYRVSPNILDVYCDYDGLLSELFFDGLGLSTYVLCSIYISAGRNVAIQQDALQSSNAQGYKTKAMAGDAVDGNLNTNLEMGFSCTLTGKEANAWWMVRYNRPQMIRHIVIVNRNLLKERLAGFVLVIYGMQDEVSEVFQNQAETSDRYTIFPTSKHPVSSLRVTLQKDEALTLCEVITYGETWCPDGTYGLWCQHKCSCQPHESCDLVTGTCSTLCPLGKFGYRCLENCPKMPFCMVKDYCQDRFGGCASCREGYMGVNCEEVCPNGTYGRSCTTKCSFGCSNGCDVGYGNCSCLTGFSGVKCDKCIDVSSWGPGCGSRCPRGCSGACNILNGNCTCKAMFLGSYCENCTNGTFGKDCDLKCPINCGNEGQCNKTTGYCFQCNGDQEMPYCHDDFGIKPYSMWLWIGILALLPLAFCLLFFFVWKRKSKPQAAAEAPPDPAPKSEAIETALSEAEVEEIQVQGSSVDVSARDNGQLDSTVIK